MKFGQAILGLSASFSLASPASAFCEYDGVHYAKTTILQEYRDSTWVVHAKVVGQTDSDDPDNPWTSYELKVVDSYKGRSPAQLTFFTERNSGGFYLERPFQGSAVGEEYLLFLNPSRLDPEDPPISKGSVFVNYECGQSKLWSELSADETAMIEKLARRQQ